MGYNLDETRASVILSFQCVSSSQDEALSVENVEKKNVKTDLTSSWSITSAASD